MCQSEADETVVPAGHLIANLVTHSLFGSEPGQVESFLCWLTISVHGHDVGERHRVVSWVVKSGTVRVGEVLDHSERCRVRWDSRQRHRTEILLAVAHQSFANSFVEHDAAGYNHATDRPVGSDAQQHPNLGDVSERVNSNRDGIDVHDRHVRPNDFEVFGRHPSGRGLGVGRFIDVRHGAR